MQRPVNPAGSVGRRLARNVRASAIGLPLHRGGARSAPAPRARPGESVASGAASYQAGPRTATAAAAATAAQAPPGGGGQEEAESILAGVERVVVQPVFRTGPWDPELLAEQEARPEACILIVGESNVCRSVIAHACLEQLLEAHGLRDMVKVESCGTRDYGLGDGPDPSAVAAAARLGLRLPAGHGARLFDPASDIVRYDLLLVLDKYTAADAMREVSSYDLVNRTLQLSRKVRRLGEFRTAGQFTPGGGPSGPGLMPWDDAVDAQDIDDPLYGNTGGAEQEAAVMRATRIIQESCEGLVDHLLALLPPGAEADARGAAGAAAAQEAEAYGDDGGEEALQEDEDIACELPLPGQQPVCYSLSSALAASGDDEASASAAAAGNGNGNGQAAPPPPAALGLGPALRASVLGMAPAKWLVPPMLSPRIDLSSA